MASIKYNIAALEGLKKDMLTLQQSDSLLRIIAEAMRGKTATRIHENGLKADGSKIGTYSSSYLKWRMNNGYETTGTDIVLFLTGQMQRDWKVIAISNTEYGLGYDNAFNADKAGWMENGTEDTTVDAHTRKVKGKDVKVKSYQRKGWDGFGTIFQHTEAELAEIKLIIDDYIKKVLA